MTAVDTTTGEVVDLTTFDACELLIERGLETFVEVGEALSVIRENRWHHDAGYRNFDDYCRERWGMSRRRSTQLIAAAETIAELDGEESGTTVPTPVNEAQARPLSKDVEPSYAVLVRQAFAEIGGRAPLGDVIRQVRDAHPERWERQALTALRDATRKALTEHGVDGMPHASSLGDHYVDRTLFNPDDYRVVVDRYIAQSDDLLETARRLAGECERKHGVILFVPRLAS